VRLLLDGVLEQRDDQRPLAGLADLSQPSRGGLVFVVGDAEVGYERADAPA
jgi:hypothetical protein